MHRLKVFTIFVQEIKKQSNYSFLILYTAVNLGFKGCARKQSFLLLWRNGIRGCFRSNILQVRVLSEVQIFRYRWVCLTSLFTKSTLRVLIVVIAQWQRLELIWMTQVRFLFTTLSSSRICRKEIANRNIRYNIYAFCVKFIGV